MKLFFSYFPSEESQFFFCKLDLDTMESTWTGWQDSIKQAKNASFTEDTEIEEESSLKEFLIVHNRRGQATFEVSNKEAIPDTLEEIIEKYPEHFI